MDRETLDAPLGAREEGLLQEEVGVRPNETGLRADEGEARAAVGRGIITAGIA